MSMSDHEYVSLPSLSRAYILVWWPGWLADELFLSTPLSEFWRHYGPSKGAANCEADFGYGLLKAWRDTNETYCAPHGPGKGSVLEFSYTGHLGGTCQAQAHDC